MTVIATGFGAQRRRRARTVTGEPAPLGGRAPTSIPATRSTCRRSCATSRAADVRAWRLTPFGAQPRLVARLEERGALFGLSGARLVVRTGVRAPPDERLASPPDADAPPHAALRPPRRARRAHGPVRRLGDAGPVRGRDPGAPGRAHATPASSTSRTWASSRSRGRPRATCCRRCSRTTSTGSSPATAQYTLLTTEDGGIVDDLIVYRLDGHRYLLSSTRRTASAVFRVAEGARAARLRRARRLRRLRAARRAGPARARAARPRAGEGVHLGRWASSTASR